MRQSEELPSRILIEINQTVSKVYQYSKFLRSCHSFISSSRAILAGPAVSLTAYCCEACARAKFSDSQKARWPPESSREL